MRSKWTEYLEELMSLLDKYDPKRSFKLRHDVRERFLEIKNAMQESYIREMLGNEVDRALKWVKVFNNEVNEAKDELGIRGIMFSKEFKSFIEDPVAHLKKKLFNYTYDLLRRKIDVEEFSRVAKAAITTSLRTNLRTLYQNWVIISLLRNLAEYGIRIVYPEYNYLLLERSGRQKTGSIPPNCIVYIKGYGYLSIFIEAPRPLSWEDTEDLRRVWKLYTALRPDVMVYRGRVLNMLAPERDPPILRPNVIIECKELEDWFMRVRDVRGPFAKPLSAEEWRSRWIRGLWDGLADILGVTREEVGEELKKRALRLHETKVVELYREFYRPDVMYLVSMTKVPKDITRELRHHGIIVLDDVGFNRRNLKRLTEDMLNRLFTTSLSKSKDIEEEVEDILENLLRRLEENGISISKNELLFLMSSYISLKEDNFINFVKKSVKMKYG